MEDGKVGGHLCDYSKVFNLIGYRVTTPKKLERYTRTGAILPPVRFWPNIFTARRWMKRTGRSIALRIEVETAYPLPDHRPAHWSPETVFEWEKENDKR
jgi:hypothetical protein